MSLLADLDRSLAAADLDERDRAAVTLARLLAEQIDEDPSRLRDLAPKLTALLRQLRLTPESRKGVKAEDVDESEQALAEVVELHPAG